MTAFKPKFPRANSLPGRALGRLLMGNALTHRSFQNETSSYRLAHFIYILHGYNWPVQSVEKIGKTNDPVGRKTIYAEYFFSPDDVQGLKNELGSRLNKFVDAVAHFEKNRGVN